MPLACTMVSTGGSDATVTVKVRMTLLLAPRSVPPSSMTLTVMTTEPVAPDAGVKVIDPRADGLE